MKDHLAPQGNEGLRIGRRQRTQKQDKLQSDAISEAVGRASRRSTRRDRAQSPKTPENPLKAITEPDTSGDEEYDSDGKLIKPGTKRKSKSILQPKGSKFSKKAAGRRQNHPPIGNDEATDALSDEDPVQQEPSPLATVTPRHPAYPYFKPPKTEEVLMVSYEVPSNRPQGPGDLWTCTLENCNHRVHRGSTSKGQAQIKEHFQLHACQAQEKIDLALRESRPYLPVKYMSLRQYCIQS